MIECTYSRGAGLCWVIQERHKKEGKRRADQRTREVAQGFWEKQCSPLITSKISIPISWKFINLISCQ